MRGSPFLMPVYGAGVAFWQGCAAVKSGMLHGGGVACCPWCWRLMACAEVGQWVWCAGDGVIGVYGV